MADAQTATSTATGLIMAFTALGGFLTGFMTEWFRDRRAAERERANALATSEREHKAREAARQMQLLERRVTFQRETLLKLQDAVVSLSRGTGKMHHFDDMEHRKTGKWGGNLLPEGLSDEIHEANVSVMVLISRVRDERIRELAQSFRNQANLVGITGTQGGDAKAFAQMGSFLPLLHERIGQVLRSLDDEEDMV